MLLFFVASARSVPRSHHRHCRIIFLYNMFNLIWTRSRSMSTHFRQCLMQYIILLCCESFTSKNRCFCFACCVIIGFWNYVYVFGRFHCWAPIINVGFSLLCFMSVCNSRPVNRKLTICTHNRHRRAEAEIKNLSSFCVCLYFFVACWTWRREQASLYRRSRHGE